MTEINLSFVILSQYAVVYCQASIVTFRTIIEMNEQLDQTEHEDSSKRASVVINSVEVNITTKKDVVPLDYIKFSMFSFLLIVPVYAMVKSFFSQNWIMLVIDALLVPVGFVHGILLLLGLVE